MLAGVLLLSLGIARPVVLFPLDARGVALDTAEHATALVKKTLLSIPKTEVIETKDVEKKLGVHLTEQARACEYDVFCLVEVGEILQSDLMVIGHVKRGAREPIDGELELKMFVLDVAKAVVIDTLVWKIPGGKDHALDDAVDAATRKLFSPASVAITFEVSPKNVEIVAYGDPWPKPKNGVLNFWPGTYHTVIRAEGYQAVEQKIIVPQGFEKWTLRLELQPDLLYTGKPKSKEVTPFDKASRREGSGVSALDVPTDVNRNTGSSPFLNPIAWGLTGTGVAGVVIGFFVARSAQGEYNDYAKEDRFLITTPSASTAKMVRDSAESRYTNGAIIAGAGAILAVGGVAWMLVESAVGDKPPPQVAASGGRAAFEVTW